MTLDPKYYSKKGTRERERERKRERDEVPVYVLFFAVNTDRVMRWKMNSISLYVFKLNIIHCLNHVNIMSTVMVWLLNNTPPPWGEGSGFSASRHVSDRYTMPRIEPAYNHRMGAISAIRHARAASRVWSDYNFVLGLPESSEICWVRHSFFCRFVCLQGTFLNSLCMFLLSLNQNNESKRGSLMMS